MVFLSIRNMDIFGDIRYELWKKNNHPLKLEIPNSIIKYKCFNTHTSSHTYYFAF